jgi:hypothetical protein
MKDLKNQSCEIILEKLEQYYSSEFVPVIVYFNELKQYSSLRTKKSDSLIKVFKENFPGAFNEGYFKEKFNSKTNLEMKVFCGGVEIDLSLTMDLIDKVFRFLDTQIYLTVRFN